jgi:arginine decarboxylase
MRKWRIEDSAELYNINGWGVNYFGINERGNVYVSAKKDDLKLEIIDLMKELRKDDVSTPVLLRFSDILRDRIETINNCFDVASREYNFKGSSYIVYPIKVNQMQPVVQEIVKHGKEFNIGLEAGSKPELHAVLGTHNNPDSMIICNGYKDEDFIELALLAQKMGKKVYIVVEKLNELKLIIQLAKKLKINPNIGIRVKLASSGSGKWESSGGDRSKFGLTASELIEACELVEAEGFKDDLKLIHFHLGSQITKIGRIKNALREASQFYVQLRKLGYNIEYVDIGGGLGVDYDGSRSSSQSSVNYSIQEYVNDAVSNLVDVSDKNDLPHPNLVVESGRSLTAHHSVLIFDVLETTSLPKWDDEIELEENEHELVKELYEIYNNITKNRMLEAWHDAMQIREESLDRFSLGLLELRTRALIERLFWSIAKEIQEISKNLKHIPDELRQLSRMLSDKYFCNFSLFQSLPDSWAIDQIFPIMPIHRLNEKPAKVATLQDITCDSDGKIDHFIGVGDYSFNLNVHDIRKNEPYYIGVFLVGAYQEILGDLHNLFGDTNAVHISIEDGEYVIKQIIDGETVDEVLDYVQYNAKKLVRSMETYVAKSVQDGKITSKEGKEFLANYRSGLYGYTYLL